MDHLFGDDEDVDIRAWRSNTIYDGYSEDSQVVKWFWEVLAGYTPEKQAKVLSFTWGSSAVPPDGFSMSFTIRKAFHGNVMSLPVAHTCEFSLDLPEYRSCAELEAK